MKKLFLFVVFFACLPYYGQPDLRPPRVKQAVLKPGTYYFATADYFNRNQTSSELLSFFNSFDLKKYYNKKKHQLDLPFDININKSTFLLSRNPSVDNRKVKGFNDVRNINISSLVCEKSKFLVDFDLNNISAPYGLLFLNDTLKSLSFNKVQGNIILGSIFVNSGSISIDDCQSGIEIADVNSPTHNIDIQISHSNRGFVLEHNYKIKKSTVDFVQDSLVGINMQYKVGNSEIAFKESYISGDVKITSDSISRIKKINFDLCTFNNVSFICKNIDTLRFANCQQFNKPMSLVIKNDEKKELFLSINNTNVNQINFDFADNIKLIFDKQTTDEEKEKTYHLLLDRYGREYKSLSHKNVDIQYQKFTFSTYGFPGKIWSYLDDIWWHYGYSKWKVIFWSIVFLFSFFLINLLFASKIFTFYQIFKDKKKLPQSLSEYTFNDFVLIFIITLYIFFSLKVAFDKLKSAQTGMMIYFFTQYFIGLICLFFLLNAILKV